MAKTSGFSFKPIDPKDIPVGRGGRASRYAATVAEFVQGGARAVELDISHSNASSASASLRHQVKKMRLDGRVSVIVRARRVFLLRTSA